MEDNNYNYNPQNGAPNFTADREDLPQFMNSPQPGFGTASGPDAREPLPQMNYYQAPQPTFAQPPMNQPAPTHPEVEACVNNAFGKGLAAAIMASFPIASIIAIVFGNNGLGLIQQANEKANLYGVKPSGKIIAAKILSLVGKIGGIVSTVYWGLFFVSFFFMMLASL